MIVNAHMHILVMMSCIYVLVKTDTVAKPILPRICKFLEMKKITFGDLISQYIGCPVLILIVFTCKYKLFYFAGRSGDWTCSNP